MGADLYIVPLADRIREIVDPIFHKLAERRDACANEDRKQRLQELVEVAYDALCPDFCYFRDSYNDSSLMSRLDGVTWGDACDHLDGRGCLRGAKLREFRDKVDAAKMILPGARRKPHLGDVVLGILAQSLAETECTVGVTAPADTDEESRRYFCDKKERLLRFLDTAIAAGLAVRFSC